MAIVPAGKTRVMVAQNFSSPLSEGYEGGSALDDGSGPISLDDGSGELETAGALEEDINEGNGLPEEETLNDDVSMGEEQQVSPKDEGRKTLTTYIFEKLQNYGYPGRRLQEYKAEFVKESISPEGVKDIQVVIPDKKYPDDRGYTDTIENEELKEIAHEVNKMFGLNFNGAERSDERWTIKFTSADLSSPEEEDISQDGLDQVYGKPDKGKSEKKPIRKASTLKEMITANKNALVHALKKRKSGD
jgi:hypothetical protein